MVTLLAAIAGFIGSICPEILKIIRDKNDKKHELEILDRQLELQKSGFTYRLQEIESSYAMSEARAIYKTYKTGIHWVDALNGTVRPVLAYAFFILYTLVKILQYSMMEANLPLYIYLDILWSVDDQAIFVAIISFYFGQRALNKIKRK
ncbi:hypothetical protein NOVO_00325 [Rickettsiales bacterium Ac37b]|nr:hypothetical protein NOVO_00325 [Rickettsiales bacterium Ac37b]